MALFNHLFPYSNLHDINLDWIISIIKSIDPAVIQALQNLTPDIIEQVNQKVNEAQAAAIAAQSSASEANTAKENAAADAALANADAVRAENAKTAVENSLIPSDLEPVPSSHIKQTTAKLVRRSGNVISISITGQTSTEAASSEFWTTLYTIPGISIPEPATFQIGMEGALQNGRIDTNGNVQIVSNAIIGEEKYFNVHVSVITSN